MALNEKYLFSIVIRRLACTSPVWPGTLGLTAPHSSAARPSSSAWLFVLVRDKSFPSAVLITCE